MFDTEKHWSSFGQTLDDKEVTLCYYEEKSLVVDKSNLFLILKLKHNKNNDSVNNNDN